MPKIAFCFLVIDSVEHSNIWKIFSQDIHETSVIFSHIKIINEKTQIWLKDNTVSTVPTAWCSEGFVFAFNKKNVRKSDYYLPNWIGL